MGVMSFLDSMNLGKETSAELGTRVDGHSRPVLIPRLPALKPSSPRLLVCSNRLHQSLAPIACTVQQSYRLYIALAVLLVLEAGPSRDRVVYSRQCLANNT
jgi:hypothetical protein